MPHNADRLDMSVTFQPVNIAVMTVSDTRTAVRVSDTVITAIFTGWNVTLMSRRSALWGISFSRLGFRRVMTLNQTLPAAEHSMKQIVPFRLRRARAATGPARRAAHGRWQDC